MTMTELSPEDIQELVKIYCTIEPPAPAQDIDDRVPIETELKIRVGLRRMIAAQKREVTEMDRKVDQAIAAVHRARTRHPSELARLPWIID